MFNQVKDGWQSRPISWRFNLLKYFYAIAFFIMSGALVVVVSSSISPRVPETFQWVRMLFTFGLFGLIGFVSARIIRGN